MVSSPYIALDASVAVLSPRFRLLARPEASTLGAKIYLGGRLVF